MGIMKDWGATLGIAVIAAVGSVAGGVWGTQINKDVEDRKLDIRMVEIALDILRSDAQDAKLQSARAFAIQSLQSYSGVSLTGSEWEAWQNSGTVPKVSLGGWSDVTDLLFTPGKQPPFVILPTNPPQTAPLNPEPTPAPE